MHPQIISASEGGVDQRPIGICMATAECMQLVINHPITVAIVVRHVPIGMWSFARCAAGEKDGQRKDCNAHNDLTIIRRTFVN